MRKSLIVLAALISAALFAAGAGTERFEKVVNGMVDAINKGDYAGAGSDYAASMEEFFPLEKRKPFFKNLSAQYGKIEKLDKPRLTPPNQAIFVVHCEKGKLDIQVWLDEKNKVCLDYRQRRQGRGSYVGPRPECLTRVKLAYLEKAFRRTLPQGAWDPALTMAEALQRGSVQTQEQ